jgi:hypothetical protein
MTDRLKALHRRAAATLALALLGGCVVAPLTLTPDDSPRVLGRQLLPAPDPGVRGALGVRTLYYGSGTDTRRAEYRDSVSLRTATVDGSKLAGPPNPEQGKVRKA